MRNLQILYLTTLLLLVSCERKTTENEIDGKKFSNLQSSSSEIKEKLTQDIKKTGAPSQETIDSSSERWGKMVNESSGSLKHLAIVMQEADAKFNEDASVLFSMNRDVQTVLILPAGTTKKQIEEKSKIVEEYLKESKSLQEKMNNQHSQYVKSRVKKLDIPQKDKGEFWDSFSETFKRNNTVLKSIRDKEQELSIVVLTIHKLLLDNFDNIEFSSTGIKFSEEESLEKYNTSLLEAHKIIQEQRKLQEEYLANIK